MLKYFLLLIALAGGAAAAPVDEIEGLLAYVGNLEGASFVRNGDAHTPAEAVAHLRTKWSAQKKQIQSAEDFIRLCATSSTVSGKPYTIRFSDGHEEKAGELLLKQLKMIRSAPAPGALKQSRYAPKPVLGPSVCCDFRSPDGSG